MRKVQISTKGILKFLKSYTEEKALCEYVWNGFDAEADVVEIITKENETGIIDCVQIIDNGKGIEYEKLSTKFTPFYYSEKSEDNNTKTSKVHGKNGFGRLTFSCFANDAKWETVYSAKSSKQKYEINISRSELEKFIPGQSVVTEENVGTKVTLYNIDKIIDVEKLKKYIMLEFCWYLKLYPYKKLLLNGEEINFQENVRDNSKFSLEDNKKTFSYEIDFVQWNKKINEEYSRYYFIDSNGNECFKETTTLNKKSDTFYHSVYIKSKMFDNFHLYKNVDENQTIIEGYSKGSEEYKFLIKEVDKFLKSKRKPYLSVVAQNLIDNYRNEEIFPEYNENNMMETFKHNELVNLVSIVCEKEPKIFAQLNREQKKTLVRLFDLIIENGDTEGLYRILDQVIDLEDDEREELADLLDKSSLSNITKTIKFIQDRYKAVEELKELIYNTKLKANEVNHLQKVIEKHYWLFGEEYSLVTAEEPDFEEALRRYVYLLNDNDEKVMIDSENKRKQMDIFAVRKNINNGKIQNIVVELKHPSNVKLGKKHLDQVETYMNTILKEPRFNNNDEEWFFYLVGTEFDSSGIIENRIENLKDKNEKGLVLNVKNYKIYVKKWSEIFDDFELKHNFLQQKLNIQKSKLLEKNKIKTAEDILDIDKGNSAAQKYDPKIECLLKK